MALSFSFNKTVKRKLTTAPSAALAEKKKKEEEEEGKIEFIQTIGANGATTKPAEETNELVIPLIKTNRWYFPKDGPKKDRKLQRKEDNAPDILINGADKDKSANANANQGLDLEQQAVREILNDARENGDKETILNIPLLVQNRIPDGFETDDNLDVALRPPEPTLDDYERIPVQEFGLAMLRGMGWKKGEGIGLRNKGVVEMKEPELRPRGLGLGATRPNTDANADKNSNSSRGSHKQKPPPSPPPMGLRLNHKK